MDYIREFDIRLDREMYYAGESLVGHVVLDTVENFKLRGENLYFLFFPFRGRGDEWGTEPAVF